MSENSQFPASLTVAQVRNVDALATEFFGMSSLVLMENAGRGAADCIAQSVSKNSSITILCGTGNNGGDGLVIARHLYASGFDVKVWILGHIQKLSTDAKANFSILQHTRLSLLELTEFHENLLPVLHKQIEASQVIVDALLGTGSQGAPRGFMKNAIEWSNRSASLRIAIDIPSGLDAQTGFCHPPTFQAHQTLTFVAEKTGFAEQNANLFLGKVKVLPIGVLPETIQMAIVAN